MGLNVELLEQSFKLVAPKADALVSRFYERLFQKYPAVKPLFKDASMAEQKKKLLASLVLVIHNLRKPEKLTEALQTLGARHVDYGAQPAHYDAVGENLLAVLGEFAGSAWTPPVKQAWTEAFGSIKAIMLQGAARHHSGTRRPAGAPQRLSRTAKQPSRAPISTQPPQEGRDMFTWFGNQKTATKLMTGFGISGLIMAGIAVFCLVNNMKMRENIENIYAVQLNPLMTLTQIRGMVHQTRANTVTAVLTKSVEDRDAAIGRVQDFTKQIDEKIAAFMPTIKAEEVRKVTDEFVKTYQDYRTFRESTILAHVKSGDQVAAVAAMKGEGSVKFKASVDAINAVIDVKTKVAKGKYENSIVTAEETRTAMIVLSSAGIALGLLFGWLIARFISRNLSDVIKAAQAMGSGDLKARSSVTTRDEVGVLAQSFNEMGEKIQAASTKSQEMICTLNNARANLLMVDRNLVITYVNEGAMKTFREVEAEIRKVLPKFDSSKLVGTCIDDFHKDAQRVRRILEDPKNMPYRADIQLGPLTLDLMVDAIRTEDGTHTGNSLEWVNVTQSRKLAIETARLSAALDSSTSNVLVCDRNYQIVYLNKASQTNLRKIESEAQKAIPGFRADKVLGSSIDMYHKNAAHQRQILDNPANLPVHKEIKLGPLTLDLTASAIVNDKGEYLGNVVEWLDVTAQKKAQTEVDRLITSASAGQLGERINAEEFEGFFKNLSQGVNKMLDAVVTPLHEAQTVLTALSQGDLRTQMTGAYEGEFDQMKTSLNAAIQNLTTTLSTVRTAAESVSTGAEQITKGNEDLSQRTSEQASSLEETSSAMEEMTSTVKQNADNAKQANQLAIAARDVAEKGGSVTTKAIDAMDEINKSSKKIADIITVIDEIAFQTNLLALNAAVEAARAGEHGRGFAVVAAEVRNLAQRSATAAKEIKGLINESVQRVTDGSELVDQSGKTLTEIVGSVKRVTDIIAEITAASQEQASGIDQVNKAIMQMDETTQQNAALVEEATSASQSMKEQARELMNQVASFKLTQGGQEQSQRPSAGSPKPSAFSAGSVKKPVLKKMAAPSKAESHQEPVAASNGKDRRSKDSEFEEF
jgi:methyl-accepting chemotaxis protein